MTSILDALFDSLAKALPYITTLIPLAFLPQAAHTMLNIRRCQLQYDAQFSLFRAARDEFTKGSTVPQEQSAAERRVCEATLAIVLIVRALLLVGVVLLYHYWHVIAPPDYWTSVTSFDNMTVPAVLWWYIFGVLKKYVVHSELTIGLRQCVATRPLEFTLRVLSLSCSVPDTQISPTMEVKTPLTLKGVLYSKKHAWHLRARSTSHYTLASLLSYLAISPLMDPRLALAIPSLCEAAKFTFNLIMPWTTEWCWSHSLLLSVKTAALICFGQFVLASSLIVVLSGDGTTRLIEAVKSASWLSGFDRTYAWISFCVQAPMLWLVCLTAPVALCLLAYRYDARTSTGFSADEVQMSLYRTRELLLVQAQQTKEYAGDRVDKDSLLFQACTNVQVVPELHFVANTPVLLSTVALPETRLHSKPVFTAGWVSLICVHAVGLLAAMISVPPFPHSVPMVRRTGADGFAFFALYWHWSTYLSLLVTPIAVLLGAEWSRKGGAREFWSYRESWLPPHREDVGRLQRIQIINLITGTRLKLLTLQVKPKKAKKRQGTK